MSKSDPDPASRILILDDPATIRRRVKRAVTDSGTEVRFDWTQKAGISNLMEMYSLFTGASMDSIEAEFGTGGYGRFKEAVAEAVVAGLAPFRQAYAALDDAEVRRIMEAGAAAARERAEGFQERVRRRVGLTA